MVEEKSGESITFLGTAGARFAVINQVSASGGLWLSLDGTEILVDPGPGCIVQAVKRNFKAENLSAIILSHRHLDHSADANIMVEAMTQGGFKRHGQFFAPSDALGTEPVIYSYLRKALDGVTILEEGKSYSVGGVSFTTPLKHVHSGVETYGMLFKTAGHSFAYIADSRYFDGLSRCYGAELLIINTVFLEPRPPIDHLSVPDAELIIRELKPKAAILTHFGTRLREAKPGQIARRLSRETGVRVLAARDGMRFDLSKLNSDESH